MNGSVRTVTNQIWHFETNLAKIVTLSTLNDFLLVQLGKTMTLKDALYSHDSWFRMLNSMVFFKDGTCHKFLTEFCRNPRKSVAEFLECPLRKPRHDCGKPRHDFRNLRHVFGT